MSLGHLRFEEVTEDSLDQLISAGTSESRDIEYKSATYGNNDDAKAEFLADVSSFANSAGGDLIIGIEESGGIPTALKPFLGDADIEIQRLENMARSGLEPRITHIRTKAVALKGSGVAILIRIPRSYVPPHRVIFKGRNRFWARSSAGKYEPNVDELRSLFTFAPQLATQIRDFHAQRVAQISAGLGPVKLRDGGAVIVHVVPFSAFLLGQNVPLELIQSNPDAFRPITGGVADWRINFDGFLTLSGAIDDGQMHRAYCQVFRRGIAEGVASSLAGGPDNLIFTRAPELAVVRGVQNYTTSLHALGVEAPFAVLVAMIGLKGLKIGDGDSFLGRRGTLFDRDQLYCSEIILEDIPSDHNACAYIVRPILDQISNAAGLARSLSFGADGRLIEKFN